MITNKSTKFFDNYWIQWGLSAAISFMLITGVFLIVEPVFMTIDDARLMYVYAGYMTGNPEANYLFSYYPLGWLISSLYCVLPGISWYAIYHFIVIGLASTIIGKVIYSTKQKRENSIMKLICFHIIVYFLFFLISTILVHFEITATLIGTAGVILLLNIRLENDSIVRIVFESFISIVCIWMCFIQQFNSFYAICCYILVSFSYLLFKATQQKKMKKTCVYMCIYTICCFSFVLGSKSIENYMKNTEEWKQYQSYNKYRVSFWDYEHITYEQNPEKFEEQGWSEEFYEAAENMYFMDKRFDKGILSNLFQRFSWGTESSIDKFLNTWKNSFIELFKNERIAILQLYTIVIFYVLILFFSVRKWEEKKNFHEIISSTCCFGGTIVLLSYLAGRGRLPIRAWFACAIPCGIILSIILIQKIIEEGRCKTCKENVIGVFLALPMLIFFVQSYKEIYLTDWKYRQSCVGQISAIEEYAIAHPENIYIYDIWGMQNYGVFTNYGSGNVPLNLIPWGSSYVFTPVYYEQLNLNEREQLLSEDLYDENVYYISHAQNPMYRDILLAMLNKDYASTRIEKIDNIADFGSVYKLKKE